MQRSPNSAGQIQGADAPRSPVVYKLGGSLLDLPALADTLREVFSLRPERAALIVVGGGKAADLVRGWDRAHNLGDERAHWLALEAMALNEALVMELLPGSREVRSANQALAAAADGVRGVLCADCFCRWAEAAGHPPLPHTWQVTSDSIAAWAADILHAEELVLLKSVDVPRGVTAAACAAAGQVDEHFPIVARGVHRVGWANARLRPAAIEPWLVNGRP